MKAPGFKILHIQDIDYQTTVRTFQEALRQIHSWSALNPKHVPLFVLLELKDDAASPLLTTPVKFDACQLDALDAEILSVFDDRQLITPDAVRSQHQTLRDAVLQAGWPTLNAARGKVMFALDNAGHHRDMYVDGHPSLRGRLLFATPRRETAPEAAFFKLNDPESQFDDIQRLVSAGFMVRTRADADTEQARMNDTTRREKAFESGAQLISTDYPEPDKQFSEYSVRFPSGHAVRLNPVNGPGEQLNDVGSHVLSRICITADCTVRPLISAARMLIELNGSSRAVTLKITSIHEAESRLSETGKR